MKNCAFLTPFYVAGYVGTTNDPSIPEWELCLADRSQWLLQKLIENSEFTVGETYNLGNDWLLTNIDNSWEEINLTPAGTPTRSDRWAKITIIRKDALAVGAVNSSPTRLDGGVAMAYVAKNREAIEAFISDFTLTNQLEIRTEADYWK